MLLANRIRLTLCCFLAYFVMSGMLAPIGIISAPMAEHFGTTRAVVTGSFSWLTLGILIGAIMALVVVGRSSLKSLFVLLYGTIFAALLSLNLGGTEFTYQKPVLGLIGVGCGIGLAAAALTIAKLYEQEQRASMLVLTDGSFSIAGFACAALAKTFVSSQLPWSATYQVVALIALCIVVLSLLSAFPQHQDSAPGTGGFRHWPIPVWFCLTALFLYTLGQSSILYWLPAAAEEFQGLPQDSANLLVGRFWLGMFFAQLFTAWWVTRIGVRNVVLLGAVATFAMSIPLWATRDGSYLPILSLLFGFANLGLLKMVLSFATELVRVPTPVLVSSLLLGATTGTAVSPTVSSKIVATFSSQTSLWFGSLCYFLLALLLLAASFHYSKKPIH